MKTNSTPEPATSAFGGEDWFDPIEAALRGRTKAFIEDLVEQEATAVLERSRYGLEKFDRQFPIHRRCPEMSS